MKKLLISLCLSLFALTGCTGNSIEKMSQIAPKDSIRNEIFTPAFQLIWNDFASQFKDGKVNFVGGNPELVHILNKSEFSVNDISENSYFKIQAPTTFKTKKIIEDAIWQKFHEKSRILDMVSWSENSSAIILYSMFKKDVSFPTAYEILPDEPFMNSKDNFKYFGTKGKVDVFARNTKPLFYDDSDNFALELSTKEGDKIILLATKSDENVAKLYKNLKTKIKKSDLKKRDVVKVPFIKLDTMIEYPELENRAIVNSDKMIEKTIDSVQFNLDNKGAKLVNEAFMLEKCSLEPNIEEPRYFVFNKPFVLYMIENGKNTPYFALKIKDTKYLVK